MIILEAPWIHHWWFFYLVQECSQELVKGESEIGGRLYSYYYCCCCWLWGRCSLHPLALPLLAAWYCFISLAMPLESRLVEFRLLPWYRELDTENFAFPRPVVRHSMHSKHSCQVWNTKLDSWPVSLFVYSLQWSFPSRGMHVRPFRPFIKRSN